MNRKEDIRWMRRALRLAGRGLGTTTPNPMVGAVIVRDGTVLGEGWHVRAGEPHAEINAIRSAAGNDLSGASMYVTLEPCSSYGRTPPCTEAIIREKISRVVIGCFDPNPKHAGRCVPILESHGISVVGPVFEAECKRRNEAFFRWITAGKPFVLLKLAETLDGRIATENGCSQWITGEAARKHVQELRQWADAVMAGGETYRMDAPRFTVRNSRGETLKTPRRIVVTRNPAKLEPHPAGWEFVSLENPADWIAYLERLGREQVTSLLVEGGGELAASALRAGVVDKVEFHIAPKILGGRNSRPSVGGENPASLSEALELEQVEVRRLGRDILVCGRLPEHDRERQNGCLPV